MSGIYVVLYGARELFPVSISLPFHEVTHVVCNDLTHGVPPVYVCVEFVPFGITTRDSYGSERAPKTISSGRFDKTCIQIARGSTRLTILSSSYLCLVTPTRPL